MIIIILANFFMPRFTTGSVDHGLEVHAMRVLDEGVSGVELERSFGQPAAFEADRTIEIEFNAALITTRNL
jgi:hypothetical protein